MIEHVAPNEVLAVWPFLQKQYRKAAARSSGDSMLEMEIVRDLCEGSKELLVAQEGEILGAIILQFQQRAKGNCCFVWVAIGNYQCRESWVPELNRYLVEYAMRRNCYCIEACVRDGVVPVLKELGWRRKATVMEIAL